MKTAMQQAIKEIAELWSSPSDTPNYTQIFNILKSKLEKEKEQIKEAYLDGRLFGCEADGLLASDHEEQYYNEIFKN